VQRYDGVLIGPGQLRQVFDNTDTEVLWLITGAPEESESLLGAKPKPDLSLICPTDPTHLPKELASVQWPPRACKVAEDAPGTTRARASGLFPRDGQLDRRAAAVFVLSHYDAADPVVLFRMNHRAVTQIHRGFDRPAFGLEFLLLLLGYFRHALRADQVQNL